MSSSLDFTFILRSICFAILLKSPSTIFNQEPYLGMNTNSKPISANLFYKGGKMGRKRSGGDYETYDKYLQPKKETKGLG